MTSQLFVKRLSSSVQSAYLLFGDTNRPLDILVRYGWRIECCWILVRCRKEHLISRWGVTQITGGIVDCSFSMIRWFTNRLIRLIVSDIACSSISCVLHPGRIWWIAFWDSLGFAFRIIIQSSIETGMSFGIKPPRKFRNIANSTMIFDLVVRWLDFIHQCSIWIVLGKIA